jgi:hypothetical protein
VGAEPEPRAQAGVIEGADQVIAPFAEVGPAVIVGRNNHGRPQDCGRGSRPGAVQRQWAVAELALDAGGAGVQDDRADVRDPPGDFRDGLDRGVAPLM